MAPKTKAKKPFLPPRRTVKRGAPPIIKPRRQMASKAALVKGRSGPGGARKDPSLPLEEKDTLSDVAVADLARGHDDETEHLESLGLAGASIAAAQGDAAPEEVAEYEKAVLAEAHENEDGPEAAE
jgi:hypothetical protein